MRRRLAMAALGVLVLLVLGVGGTLPASGNEPEGEFTTLDVDRATTSRCRRR